MYLCYVLKYIIGFPCDLELSQNTFEMRFDEFCLNSELADLLNLMSTFECIDPVSSMVNYLSSIRTEDFSDEDKDYLSGGGIIRICVLDEELIGKVKETLDGK